MVVGTGYVGLVQAACLAHLGHNVAGVDIDENKIKMLKEAKVPFFEPGLSELVEEGLKNGRLTFHASQASALALNGQPEAIFVCVQTPRNEDGSCNLSAVESVCRKLSENCDGGLVVIKSTVPPGSREQMRDWLSGTFEIASNPEFLREGKSVHDFFHPDRILIGAETKQAAEIIAKIHEGIDAPVFTVSVESAQLAKYASNTMLAMRLSLMNEIANIADAVGADIKDVEAVVGSDPRIGSKFLRAGAGFGGSCFPKDVLALSHIATEHNCESLLINPIIETNDRQPTKFVEKIARKLEGIEGKTIAVWGLAFNRDTDDVRESPAIKIVTELADRGASITVFDPEALENARKELGDMVRYASSMQDALESADALAVLTEWPQFENADWEFVRKILRTVHIFDGKNFLPRERLEGLGFEVHGMGLCAKHKRRPR